MNIQQIDLDKNLVIPLPDGFTKQELAIISATYSNYIDKIDQYNTHTFVGTQEEFEKQIENRIPGLNLWVIEIETLEENKYSFNYQTLDKVDNPESIIDFGIRKAIITLGNYIREAIRTTQTKQEQELLKNKKELVEQQLSILDNIKAI